MAADGTGSRTRGLEVVGADDLGTEVYDPSTLSGGGGDPDDDNGDSGPVDGDGFDPDLHISRERRNADGSYRRKRVRGGRERDGAGSTRKASSRLDITGVQAVLYSTHAALSAATGNPIWQLANDESKALAGAIINLEKQYPTRIDPRAMAWVNLIGVAGAIYGSRLIAMRLDAVTRKQAGQAGKAPPRAGPPPPSDVSKGPIHAEVRTPDNGPPTGTTYVKVPPGFMDEAALAAAMAAVNGGPRAPS